MGLSFFLAVELSVWMLLFEKAFFRGFHFVFSSVLNRVPFLLFENPHLSGATEFFFVFNSVITVPGSIGQVTLV